MSDKTFPYYINFKVRARFARRNKRDVPSIVDVNKKCNSNHLKLIMTEVCEEIFSRMKDSEHVEQHCRLEGNNSREGE